MTYLLRRGPGSLRRRAHLARYDAFGQIASSWCGRRDFNLTSNVPWGCCKTCRHCINAQSRFRTGLQNLPDLHDHDPDMEPCSISCPRSRTGQQEES